MSRSSETDACKEEGFTLVELLATIALLSLVSLILLRALNFGFKAWEGGTAHANRVDHVMMVQDFLRRTIEDAYPYMSGGDPTRRRIDLDGTAESLSFLASAPRALGGGGRSRMLLSVVRHDGVADLALTSNLELANEASPPTRKVLIANAASISFSYFGKGRSDRGAEWRTQWTGEVFQPKLVRIHVQFPSGDTRAWPDLIIAPRISVHVGCIYDPLTKQCRGL